MVRTDRLSASQHQDRHAPGAGRSLLRMFRMICSAACRTALAFAVAPLLLLLLEALGASAGEDVGDTDSRGDRADAAAWPLALAAIAVARSLLNADAGALASESRDLLLLLESHEPLGLATGRRSDAHAVSTCMTQALSFGCRIFVNRFTSQWHETVV